MPRLLACSRTSKNFGHGRTHTKGVCCSTVVVTRPRLPGHAACLQTDQRNDTEQETDIAVPSFSASIKILIRAVSPSAIRIVEQDIFIEEDNAFTKPPALSRHLLCFSWYSNYLSMKNTAVIRKPLRTFRLQDSK